ncbi:MAG: sigma 54-interacting transcriptional regulator [Deltaproteobacteria bacterium]|nr:sigma 54-interacting transcriptional regulator [Deltaproteobacteria bacterium]
MPKTVQVKLLRVIETNEVFPVGSDSSHSVSVRYIAATHKDLEAMTEGGEFRRDLFERLAGNVIHIPPLRDRPEDILEIGRTFVRSYLNQRAHSRRLADIDTWLNSREARSYRWPGNVRELQNALRNMMLGLSAGLKSHGHSAPVVGASSDSDIPDPIRGSTATLEAVEDWYIHRVLESNEGNYSQSARILGIDRSTVKRRTSG